MHVSINSDHHMTIALHAAAAADSEGTAHGFTDSWLLLVGWIDNLLRRI